MPKRNAWEQQPGETDKAFAPFKAFLDAGPGREKFAVYREFYGKPNVKGQPGFFSEWAKKHNWDARALDYDNHIRAIEDKAVEKVVETESAKRERRKQKLADDGFEIGKMLIKRGREMLQTPMHRITKSEPIIGPDGKTTIQQTIIEPVKWSAKDIPAIVQTGIKLCQMSFDSDLADDIEVEDHKPIDMSHTTRDVAAIIDILTRNRLTHEAANDK